MQLIDPAPAKATLEQGFSYIKKGDLGKAIAVMDELIARDPYLAQAYWGRALCFEYRALNFEDIALAISDYSKSIVYSDEPSSLSYGRRGILYFKSAKFEEALADLTKALEFDLLWTEARFYRGRTYLALERDKNDIVNAENDFTEVIKALDKPFAPAFFWRAQARRQLNNAEAAVADYERALVFDPDDALALNALAYCNEHGIGTKINRKRAEELYEQSAESGFTVAQKNLAWFYTEDESDENAEKSAYWMKKAADDGDVEAQNLYGLRLLHGRGVESDEFEAARYFKRSARQSYLPACCNLADCYEHGLGVAEDAARAFELYKEAAEKGSVLAKYNLGRCYYFGIGVAEDNDKAFAALKPVADGGYARAEDLIGMCYENGYGVMRDTKLAGKYFKKAYDQGLAHAATHLAARARAGRGVKKSLSAAISLYNEAAKRGSSYALYALGRLYFEDKCDYENAADAFRRAIAAGEENISVWLARALMHTKDPRSHAAEAHALLLKAVENETDKLHSAMFLCDFDFFGLYGWPINPEAAVNRVTTIVETGEAKMGLSCAYAFLAQASELGLGTEQSDDKAVEYYVKASNARETGGCRCYVANIAHMLYQGLCAVPTPDAAYNFLRQEIRDNPDTASNETRLMYIWAQLTHPEQADHAELIGLAKKILHEEPNDPIAAYMLYFLQRGQPQEKKLLASLKKSLQLASPYYRNLIEQQLKNSPDEVLYPVLTKKRFA